MTPLPPSNPSKKLSIDCLFVAFICFVLFSLQLGNRPFATPDEGRYVEIPREMVATGDWVTPRLNGVKYFEKPPFLYWLQACSFKVFGLNEFGMRLWIVLFATLGCVATYAFGRSIFDRTTGLMAAGILATTALYFSLARLIILDMVVSTWVTLALFCFYQALSKPASQNRRLWFYGFSAACAFGVLTKGIMALAVPGPLIVLWLTYTRQWRLVLPLYFVGSCVVFLAITAPWHILVSLKNPEFAYKYFIVEHFLRYTTSIHARYKPVWFFLPITLVGLLPWTTFLYDAWKTFWGRRTSPLYSYLWMWIGWVLLFFSVSNSKLIPYILPIFPPLALLVAHSLREACQNRSHMVFYRHSFVMIILGMLGFIVPNALPEVLDEKIGLIPYIYGLSGLFLAHGFSVVICLKRDSITSALSSIGVTAVIMTVILGAAAPHVQRPSLKGLVNIILKEQKPGEPIVSFLTYYQDLPLYSQQRVMVVGAKGELDFGTTVEDTTEWIVTEEAFLQKWQAAQRGGHKIWAVGRLHDVEVFQRKNTGFHFGITSIDGPNVLFHN
ncbi:phospholipid carrier-dependent glycosyltransferase [Candidatus Finniella inopinata]|uniref:Phospholipid carrier-dependent glycosyltransferase n=1 Tax=Candidatus Finniella inopinata TaxID=1696036 RepID=A0A4Q7DJ41_9PROT|nr:phospholipid carrier-dependent glycosyltransferase [Candidatus Finniella inopinata]RZI46863.1 phospholipid carrier-dependent glycosyltransferase [Candidatus Finniella inopinata]